MDVPRTSSRTTALAVTALLLAGGCGGGTDEPSGSPPAPAETTSTAQSSPVEALDTAVPDLCTLFTAADFESVLGEPAAEPEGQGATGAIRGTCTITAETGFPLVILGAYDEADRETTLSMVEAEPVDDLGVEAYWDDTIGLVVPLEGRDWYLQVMATDGGADLDTSVRVAEVALDRL